ncbi:MAG: Hsp70 family protein [Solirubrobacterales bacterium]
MSAWILAIDFGTTSTAAARRVGERVEMIQLQGGPRMPSMTYWREGTATGGRLVLGNEAEELSTLAPWCLERTPKRRLGEDFIQLGDKQLRPVEIVAAILKEVYDEAIALSGGEPPAEVRLTHPARWQKARLDKLAQAARLAGITDPVFVPEPVAAAVHFASERLQDGEHVAVYDLGGGTLDTAVLKRTRDSFEVVGRTGGNEELGGEDFDDLLYRHLADQLPGDALQAMREADEDRDRTWAQANRSLLRQARRAKEGLSRSPEYEIYLPAPIDKEVEATAAEFERLIAPTLRGTVSELERTILAAGIKVADVKAIYLAGGSSRIPLVARLIHEELGIAPEHLDDPKAVIAMGAARMATSAAERTEVHSPPLEEGAIPKLPGAGEAEAEASDSPAAETEIAEPESVDPTILDSPPPPPPVDPPGGGAAAGGNAAGSPGPTGPTGPTGPARKGNGRGRILAGLAAAVVVLAGAGAAIALSGGGDGDASAEEPPPSSPDPVTPAPDPPTPYGLIKMSLTPRVHATCEPEDENDYEQGALAGVICDGKYGTTVYNEAYQSRAAAQRVFQRFAGGRSDGDCGTGWEVQSAWYYDDKSNIRGRYTCYDNDDGNAVMVWTDRENRTVGFVFGFDGQSREQVYRAWAGAVSQG